MAVMRILVDMDSVLSDYEGYFVKCFRQKYPDEPWVPIESRRHYALDDDYKELEGQSPGIVAKTRLIYETRGFFANLPPIPGAVDAMNAMAQMENVKVYICTANITKTPGVHYDMAEKLAWIERHLGHKWTQRVFFAKDKTMVDGNIIIDDKPCIKGAVQPPHWTHILFTAAHNRHVVLADSSAEERLNSWTDLTTLRAIINKYKPRG